MVWNKYPQRDKEKNYRFGNGFSHMLNMLNVDMKGQDNYNSEDNNIGSDYEANKIPIMAAKILNKTKSKANMISTIGFSTFNRSNILPKISSKNEETSNLTAENGEKNIDQGIIDNIGQLNVNEDNNIINAYKQPQPHIVKVYRKNKYSAPDITRMDEQ